MLNNIATSVKSLLQSQNRYAAEVAVYVHMLLSVTLIKKQETQESQQNIESGKK